MQGRWKLPGIRGNIGRTPRYLISRLKIRIEDAAFLQELIEGLNAKIGSWRPFKEQLFNAIRGSLANDIEVVERLVNPKRNYRRNQMLSEDVDALVRGNLVPYPPGGSSPAEGLRLGVNRQIDIQMADLLYRYALAYIKDFYAKRRSSCPISTNNTFSEFYRFLDLAFGKAEIENKGRQLVHHN